MKNRGHVSYLGISENRKQPRSSKAPSSVRPRPHQPLADAGESATETMKEPEGLIPSRRRRHRLADGARKPKPR